MSRKPCGRRLLPTIVVRRILYLALLVPWLAVESSGQKRQIDVQRSSLTVHVYKSGIFSAFADNHEIRAPISSGFVDEAAHSVELEIDVRKLVVLDPSISAGKRQEVQERMLGPEVLDSTRFPEIRFVGRDAKRKTPDQVEVSGTLSLRGTTQTIALRVTSSGERFRGDVTLKQHDFGITPITIAGGAVRVKDEIKIDFDIVIESR